MQNSKLQLKSQKLKPLPFTLYPLPYASPKPLERGQTIIEVLVALAVATTIVSAITVSVITALTNVQYSRTQNEATHIAQQSIDLVRQKRDANFTQFSTDYAVDAATGSNKIYCLGKGVDEFPAKESARLESQGCTTLYDNKYVRYIKLEKGSSARNCALTGTPIPATAPGGEAIKLTSVVEWADAKCKGEERCHKVELVTCLYNILQIIDVTNTPTPTITPTPTPTPAFPVVNSIICGYEGTNNRTHAIIRGNNFGSFISGVTTVTSGGNTMSIGPTYVGSETSSSGWTNTQISGEFTPPLQPGTQTLTATKATGERVTGTCTTGTPLPTPTPIPPKRVFVTSTSYTGNFGSAGAVGQPSADAQCRVRANAVGLGTNWKSWTSDSSSSPNTRFTRSDGPYVLLNGTRIADNYAGLISGTLLANINIDENRNTVSGSTLVWTGTTRAGEKAPYTCLDWVTTSTNESAYYGQTNFSTAPWTYSYYLFCQNSARLYCFEQ